MNHRILLISSLACAIALPAQGEQDPHSDARPQATMRAADQAALSAVLGAKVRLAPGADERGEHATEGRAADRPSGSISDLILIAPTGQASWAVVSVGQLIGGGDKEIAVPTAALRCKRSQDQQPVFDLAATEAELKALPAFDRTMLQELGLRAAVRQAETAWHEVRQDGAGQPADASGARPRDPEAKAADAAAVAPELMLATQLKGMPVRCVDAAEGKDFGEVESACVDLRSTTVAFLIVGRGGVLGIGETEYLVPVEATRLVPAGEDRKPTLSLPKTTAEMDTGAPKYEKPDTGIVSEANARRSCEFFGVHPGRHPKGHDRDGDEGRQPGNGDR